MISAWQEMSRQTKRHLRNLRSGNYVYGIFDCENICLYIGQTSNMPARFDYEHYHRFTPFGPITVHWLETDQPLQVETLLIEHFGPCENQTDEIHRFSAAATFDGWDGSFDLK